MSRHRCADGWGNCPECEADGYAEDEVVAAYEQWVESQVDAAREERAFGRP